MTYGIITLLNFCTPQILYGCLFEVFFSYALASSSLKSWVRPCLPPQQVVNFIVLVASLIMFLKYINHICCYISLSSISNKIYNIFNIFP